MTLKVKGTHSGADASEDTTRQQMTPGNEGEVTMKRSQLSLLASAALLVAGPALAQVTGPAGPVPPTGPTTGPSTTTPPDARMPDSRPASPDVDDTMGSESMDANPMDGRAASPDPVAPTSRSTPEMTRQGTTAPTMSEPNGSAASGSAMASNRTYPLCSRTVTDSCMNPGEAPRGYNPGG